MISPSVRLSEGFLAKFPKNKRAGVEISMQHVVDALLYGKEDEVTQEEVANIVAAGEFDPDAVIVFHESFARNIRGTRLENKDHIMPIMTGLFAAENYQQTCWLRELLASYIKKHPRMNDEAGNGSFAPPFGCAVRDRITYSIDLVEQLSYNPHANPNATWDDMAFTAFKHSFLSESQQMMRGSDARTPRVDTVLENMLDASSSLSSKEFSKHVKCIKRLIDHGAVITPHARTTIDELEKLKPIKEYIETNELLLSAVSASTCMPKDIILGYGMGCLNDWFIQASQDESARQHMLTLRQELPQWLCNELSVAYQLLGADWITRTNTEARVHSGGRA